MAKSLPTQQHLNGNQICAIDLETTGLDPCIHEIIQLAIIPLDHMLNPRTDTLPLNIFIKPECPETATKEAMTTNKINLNELMVTGLSQEEARFVFDEWTDTLNLTHSKFGQRKKIMPLGHNFSTFDQSFLKNWLGIETYDYYFDYHVRDTTTLALAWNDRAARRGLEVPFKKVKLNRLAEYLYIPFRKPHDALNDARVAAEVYKKLLDQVL